MAAKFQRYSPLILLAVPLLLPLLLFGAGGAMRGGDNDVRQWLPQDMQETRRYDWFLERFGSEEMIVASWPGCSVDDPRLQQLATQLTPYVEPPAGEAATATNPAWFRRIVTGADALRELTSSPLNLSAEAARQRLQGMLLGPDGRTTGMVITVSDAGAQHRAAAVESLYRAAEQAGISREQLRLGGPTIDSVALDSESQRSRYLLAGLAVVLTFALAWGCLREARLSLLVFGAALFCALGAVAIVYYTGGAMSLLLMMMPTLVYVLALSACVHLVGYYREALRTVGPVAAPLEALSAAWLPCSLSALTTCLGMGSLGWSDVLPVKLFGLYSAAGVMFSLPVVLLVLPAALSRWPSRVARETRPTAAKIAARGLLLRWQQGVLRHHAWVVGGAVALMLLLGAGLARLETSVKLLNLFSPQSRIIHDYTWLEKHLGPLVPVEVIVQFADTQPLLEQMRLVGRIQQRIDALDKVGGTLSAATFAPATPEGGGLRRTAQRAVLERRLRTQAESDASQYLKHDEQNQLWRISARVEALNSLDYGLFLNEMRQQVKPLLAATTTDQVQVMYTGVVPLIYKAQRVLLDDLTRSFISAFLMIGGVMIVVARGVRAGLLMMLPNLFPAVLVFGGMGWLGRLCDVGSMMTASVALGIAVDDTLHYLSWFRRGARAGMSRREAIELAYARCAGAMSQTTIICGLGLLVFAFSSFVPTARFAYLLVTMLVAALVGDLVLLPAILAGPLGRLLVRSRHDPPSKTPVPAPAPLCFPISEGAT